MIRIFSFLLIFFSCQILFAQGKITHPHKTTTPIQQEHASTTTKSLPTTVAGYKLGQMSRNGAEKYTYDKGYSLSYSNGSKLTAHYVDFAGYIWNDVELYFHQNKLYKVVFLNPDFPSEHKTYGNNSDNNLHDERYKLFSRS